MTRKRHRESRDLQSQEKVNLLPGRSVSRTDVLLLNPSLPERWWTALRGSLDSLATTGRDRMLVDQPYVDELVRKRFGSAVNTTVTEWETVHGDLHWANVFVPELGIADWEWWGRGPVGLDAATLLCNSLLIPKTAENSLYENSYSIDFFTKLLTESAQRRPRHRHDVVAAPAAPATINLDQVSFTYPGQTDPAITDVSFTIRRGQTIALVGENGSGKTTLAKLIVGLYPPTTGKVTWDGVSLRNVHEHSIHNQIGVISQEPATWPMTAARNILIGRYHQCHRDGEAWTSATGAAGADTVIASLPRHENTLLSKRFQDGQDLSVGQWQRVGIARGLYRDANILVADEPSSGLDAKAEANLFAHLYKGTNRGNRSPRTTILVTHRLANIREADNILVLQHGRITESGTHDALIAHRGLYFDLFEIQANAYRDN